MSDFRKIGKEDPEPWKPDEVEYALYDDIDRTKIKGYGDDEGDDEDDDEDEDEDEDEYEDETSSVTSSNTSSTSNSTSKSKSTPILNRKRKPRPVVHYDQLLQEDTNFVSEK